MDNIYPLSYQKIFSRSDYFSTRLLKEVAREAINQPALSRVRDLTNQYGDCDIEDAKKERELLNHILQGDGRTQSFEKAIQDLLGFYQELESRTNLTEVE